MVKKINELPEESILNRGDLIPVVQEGETRAYSFNGRIPVTSDLTLFVDPNGNDDNDGLTSGTPFKTLTRAFDIGSTVFDLGNNTLIIQLADGTYTYDESSLGFNIPRITTSNTIFNPKLIIRGNQSNPQNVLLNKSDGHTSVIYIGNNTSLFLEHLSIENTSSGSGIVCNGFLQFQNIRFGACNVDHMTIGRGGTIEVRGNYTIYGSAQRHVFVGGVSRAGGAFDATSHTCTLTGTPNFSNCFISCRGNSVAGSILTFSGSATGVRYRADRGGVIDVNGAGDSYLPGNSNGVVTNSGLYV